MYSGLDYLMAGLESIGVEGVFIPYSIKSRIVKLKESTIDTVFYRELISIVEHDLVTRNNYAVLVFEEDLLSSPPILLKHMIRNGLWVIMTNTFSENCIDSRSIITNVSKDILIIEPKNLQDLRDGIIALSDALKKKYMPIILYVPQSIIFKQVIFPPLSHRSRSKRRSKLLTSIIAKDKKRFLRNLVNAKEFFEYFPENKKVTVITIGYASSVINSIWSSYSWKERPSLVKLGFSYPMIPEILETIMDNEPIEIVLIDLKSDFPANLLIKELSKIYMEGKIDFIPKIHYYKSFKKILDKEVRYFTSDFLDAVMRTQEIVTMMHKSLPTINTPWISATINFMRMFGIKRLIIYSNDLNNAEQWKKACEKNIGVTIRFSTKFKANSFEKGDLIVIEDFLLQHDINSIYEIISTIRKGLETRFLIVCNDDTSRKRLERILRREGANPYYVDTPDKLINLRNSPGEIPEILIISKKQRFEKKKIMINYKICTKCGQCALNTHCSAIKRNFEGAILIDPIECMSCGFCEIFCPINAIIEESASKEDT